LERTSPILKILNFFLLINFRDGKLFESRFFHSFESIHSIVATLRSGEPRHTIWEEKKDAFGHDPVPLELLVLGSFRMLTRNVTLDDCYEATFISTGRHRVFHKRFMKWYAEVRFPLAVKMPTLDELDGHCAEYAAAGVPGAPMSVDVVHIRLWNVAANLKQLSTGKEKFPSRAYEVMVNHRGIFISAIIFI